MAHLGSSAGRTGSSEHERNVRPAPLGRLSHARAGIERLVGLSDVVEVSDEDLPWLSRGRPGRSIERVDTDLLGGDRREAMATIEEPTLVDVLDAATSAAAVTCSLPGADPPTRTETDGVT